jgi:dodecin
MSDHHTYKKVELVGSSTTSIEDAISNALAEANKSIKHLEWFEVTDTAWSHQGRQGCALSR